MKAILGKLGSSLKAERDEMYQLKLAEKEVNMRNLKIMNEARVHKLNPDMRIKTHFKSGSSIF